MHALVLGCTGLLGGRTVEKLLANGASVTGLVRTVRPDSTFIRNRLHEKIHVVRGDLFDAGRLASLLAAHEITTVYQCAAAPGPIAATHALTHRVFAAVVEAAPNATVVVPVPLDLPQTAIRFRTAAAGGLRAAFVRLPRFTSVNLDAAAAALMEAADEVGSFALIPPTGLWVSPAVPAADAPVSLPRAA